MWGIEAHPIMAAGKALLTYYIFEGILVAQAGASHPTSSPVQGRKAGLLNSMEYLM